MFTFLCKVLEKYPIFMLYSYSFYLELILNFNNIEDKKHLYKETKHGTYILTYITNE